MKRNLSVELRPRRLSELIGQESLVEELRNGMSKRIPLGIMLVGESGAGKTTIAEILSIAVQCTHAPFGEPCDECLDSLVFNITERNCAQLGKIEDITQAISGIENGIFAGKYRVFIFDEAHEIGTKAQEVLYIPMEQKDLPNLFIFPTTDPKKLLDPIKRRCKIFQVPTLNSDGVKRLVESTIVRAEGCMVKPPEPLVMELIKNQQYSPGFIVTAVERYLDGVPAATAVAVKDGSSLDMGALIGSMSRGDFRGCQAVLEFATTADVDGLKLKLAAYWRKVLLNSTNSAVRLQVAARAIHELSGNNASVVYETGFQLSILTASIYKICEIVQSAVAARSAGKQLPQTNWSAERTTVQ